MQGWMIALAILAFLLFLLFVPVRIVVRYRDSLKVHAGILFLRFSLYPHKAKVHPRQFTVSALRRRAKKIKKKENQYKKPSSGKKKKQEKKEDHDIPALLRLIWRILKTTIGRTGKYMKLHVRDLTIRLGTEEAAQTALLYGTVSAALHQLWAGVRYIGIISKRSKKRIYLIADFGQEKCDFSCDIKLTTNLLRVLCFALHTLVLSLKKEPAHTETKEEKNTREEKEARAREAMVRELSGKK